MSDLRPAFGEVIRLRNAKSSSFPSYAVQAQYGAGWLNAATAGTTCENCNSDEAVVLLLGRVRLCCKCLEEAASYAQL